VSSAESNGGAAAAVTLATARSTARHTAAGALTFERTFVLYRPRTTLGNGLEEERA
jgi:hypothetical protein